MAKAHSTHKRRPFTPEEDAVFREHYPGKGPTKTASLLGRPLGSVVRRAHVLGLKFSPTSDPIPPFPATVDRSYFAAYLSGLVDGEGCFSLDVGRRSGTPTFSARLAINLRADDRPVLELVRSFWQCGILRRKHRPDAKYADTVCFSIHRVGQLVNVVIPHFTHCPLLAKKKNDFAIWREAVHFLHAVSSRPRRSLGRGVGFLRRWAEEDRARFLAFQRALRACRVFVG